MEHSRFFVHDPRFLASSPVREEEWTATSTTQCKGAKTHIPPDDGLARNPGSWTKKRECSILQIYIFKLIQISIFYLNKFVLLLKTQEKCIITLCKTSLLFFNISKSNNHYLDCQNLFSKYVLAKYFWNPFNSTVFV